MKLSQVLEGLKVLKVHGDLQMDVSDIVYDSRMVTPGSAFVAVRGFETDGHKYIPQAVAQGSAAVF